MQPKTWWIQVIYARINNHQPSLKWNAHVMVLPDLIRCWDIYEYATNFDSYVTFETLAGCCYTLHQTIPMFIDALDATYYPAVSHIHQLLDTWVDDDKVPTHHHSPGTSSHFWHLYTESSFSIWSWLFILLMLHPRTNIKLAHLPVIQPITDVTTVLLCLFFSEGSWILHH